MKYRVSLTPNARADLAALRARDRAIVRDAVERYLAHEPLKTSISRIKELRELARPRFRLRVADFRVFYDVRDSEVEVLGVVAKSDAARWLTEFGVSE